MEHSKWPTSKTKSIFLTNNLSGGCVLRVKIKLYLSGGWVLRVKIKLYFNQKWGWQIRSKLRTRELCPNKGGVITGLCCGLHFQDTPYTIIMNDVSRSQGLATAQDPGHYLLSPIKTGLGTWEWGSNLVKNTQQVSNDFKKSKFISKHKCPAHFREPQGVYGLIETKEEAD